MGGARDDRVWSCFFFFSHLLPHKKPRIWSCCCRLTVELINFGLCQVVWQEVGTVDTTRGNGSKHLKTIEVPDFFFEHHSTTICQACYSRMVAQSALRWFEYWLMSLVFVAIRRHFSSRLDIRFVPGQLLAQCHWLLFAHRCGRCWERRRYVYMWDLQRYK